MKFYAHVLLFWAVSLATMFSIPPVMYAYHQWREYWELSERLLSCAGC